MYDMSFFTQNYVEKTNHNISYFRQQLVKSPKIVIMTLIPETLTVKCSLQNRVLRDGLGPDAGGRGQDDVPEREERLHAEGQDQRVQKQLEAFY
jgi:hypothetical protein